MTHLARWEWETLEARPTNIPDGCPQCEQGPILARLKARFRHWTAMRGVRKPDYIGTLWSSDTLTAIEHAAVLSKMVEKEYGP